MGGVYFIIWILPFQLSNHTVSSFLNYESYYFYNCSKFVFFKLVISQFVSLLCRLNLRFLDPNIVCVWWWCFFGPRQKAKPSLIPAVEVEPPGCSFNPEDESHKVITENTSCNSFVRTTLHADLFSCLSQIRTLWRNLLQRRWRKCTKVSWGLSQFLWPFLERRLVKNCLLYTSPSPRD